MKVEGQSESTMQSAYEGQAPQVHNKEIDAVLLQSGWHPIIKGSFKLHKTHADVPFVRFQLDHHPAYTQSDKAHTVEVFPMGLHGVAYPASLPANEEPEIGQMVGNPPKPYGEGSNA